MINMRLGILKEKKKKTGMIYVFVLDWYTETGGAMAN